MFFPFIFISWRLITLQYYSGFCHTLTWISHGFTCIPHPNLPSHLLPSTWSLWVFPVHQARALVSRIQPELVIWFTLDNIHVLMLFSRNIPSSPSPTESKSLFCTSVTGVQTCALPILFSWNIPSSPSPTESKRLFYKSVSFFFFFCSAYRVIINIFLNSQR